MHGESLVALVLLTCAVPAAAQGPGTDARSAQDEPAWMPLRWGARWDYVVRVDGRPDATFSREVVQAVPREDGLAWEVAETDGGSTVLRLWQVRRDAVCASHRPHASRRGLGDRLLVRALPVPPGIEVRWQEPSRRTTEPDENSQLAPDAFPIDFQLVDPTQEVTVPAGTWPAAVVTQRFVVPPSKGKESPPPTVITRWFVRDVGIVREVVEDPGQARIVRELVRHRRQTPAHGTRAAALRAFAVAENERRPRATLGEFSPVDLPADLAAEFGALAVTWRRSGAKREAELVVVQDGRVRTFDPRDPAHCNALLRERAARADEETPSARETRRRTTRLVAHLLALLSADGPRAPLGAEDVVAELPGERDGEIRVQARASGEVELAAGDTASAAKRVELVWRGDEIVAVRTRLPAGEWQVER